MIEFYSKEDFNRQSSGSVVIATIDGKNDPPALFYMETLENNMQDIHGSIITNDNWVPATIYGASHSIEYVCPERGLYNVTSKLPVNSCLFLDYTITRQYYKGFNKHRVRGSWLTHCVESGNLPASLPTFEASVVRALFYPVYYSFAEALDKLKSAISPSAIALSKEFAVLANLKVSGATFPENLTVLTYFQIPIGTVKNGEVLLFPKNEFMIQALREIQVPVAEVAHE